MLFNLDDGNRVYNIQSGFKPDFDAKIALGTLHIGYVLEHLFAVQHIHTFDFLEGSGKNQNYKTHIANAGPEIQTSRWFRSSLLTLIFKGYDRFLRR